LKDQNNNLLPKLKLNELSAREIQTFAEDLEKTNKKNDQKKETFQNEFSTQIKVALMTRLDIPHVRVAQRLNIHRETISKYAQKNQELFNKIHQEFKNGSSIPDIAQKYFIPQPLVWSVILQEKTDQERFKHLNWGLRTWITGISMMLITGSEMTGPEESRPSSLPTLFFILQAKTILCLIPWQAGVWLQTPVLPLTEDAGLLIFWTGLKLGLK